MKRSREEGETSEIHSKKKSMNGETLKRMCVCVKQFGKRLTKKQTKTTLDKIGLNGLVRFEKPYNNDMLFLHFDTPEHEQDAIKTLSEYNKKWKVMLQRAKGLDEERKREQHAMKIKLAMDESQQKPITETVTPLAHLPYEQQLQEKENEIVSILKENFVSPLLNEWNNWAKKETTTDFTKDEKSLIPSYLKQENERRLCFEWKGIEPSPIIDGYRNNCEFTIGFDINNNVCVGFLQGSFNQGFHTTASPKDCKHISQVSKNVVQIMQEFVEKCIEKDIQENGPIREENQELDVGNTAAAAAFLSICSKRERSRYDPYDKPTHRGFFRFIKVRENREGQVLVLCQVNPKNFSNEELEQFKNNLLEHFLSYDAGNEVSRSKPFQINLVSLWVQMYEGWSNAAPPETPIEKIYGDDVMIEKVLGLKFQISPLSFFQVNTRGAERLYSIAGEWAQIGDKKPILLDVCCGTGTIGMSSSHKVQKVIGLEISESAVRDAEKNAKLNNIDNIDFVCGKAEDTLGPQLAQRIAPNQDVIAIVDPPRAGLHHKVLRALLKCNAIDRLVYVSCNAKTLAENAVLLCKPPSKATDFSIPFKPIKAIAMDMFPHTNHCEMIMLFERNRT